MAPFDPFSEDRHVGAHGGRSKMSGLLPQVLLNGLLMGLVYCLIATGLTLIWGVMDLVNFAHGEFLMLAMYLAYWLNVLARLDPMLSLPAGAVVFFGAGVALYKLIVRPVTQRGTVLSRILVTFGVGIVLGNVALYLWTPNYRLASAALVTGAVSWRTLSVSTPRLAAAVISVVVSAALFFFLRTTRAGRALQATAMDRGAAALMGIDVEQMFSLSWGLAIGLVGIAGCLLANFMYVFPGVGSVFSLLAFAAVAMGGFGSVPGALIGSVLIGEAEALGGFLVGPAFKYMIVYTLYLLVLVVRPKGLMGW